nr:immunoglobulin heavy chain junction region [Mus musculus]
TLQSISVQEEEPMV